MNQEKIGKLIAQLRKEYNLTQDELGKKLGVTRNAVSKWERGLCLMDMTLLKPICEIFDITIIELLNGEKIENKDISEKSEIIVEQTINYSQKQIKKSKKIVLLFFLVLFMFITFIILNKTILLYKYSYKKQDNYNEIIDGLTTRNTIKIYKKTIDDNLYIVEDNYKIRNDFVNYIIERESNVIKYLKNDNNNLISAIYSSKNPQYLDIFSSNDVQIFNMEDNVNYSKQFNSADRKYFLLRNDINDDIDFLEYIKENGNKNNNLLTNKREILEKYALDLFVSTAIPEVNNITIINGDYRGYIFNRDNSREIHIIRDNQDYVFTMIGKEFQSDEYIIDLFSTLEIK